MKLRPLSYEIVDCDGNVVFQDGLLFTGVNLIKGKADKWRVENSWGTKGGSKGYYLMTDNWFDEYNYEIVVDKSYLPKRLIEIFNREPVILDPWDPMGSLAK